MSRTIPTGGLRDTVSLYLFQARSFCLINLQRTLDRNYDTLYHSVTVLIPNHWPCACTGWTYTHGRPCV